MTEHVVINVGMARSGTTVAMSFMRRARGVATPVGRGERNALGAHDVDRVPSLAWFGAGGDVLFEASRRYAPGGAARPSKVPASVRGSASADRRNAITLLLRIGHAGQPDACLSVLSAEKGVDGVASEGSRRVTGVARSPHLRCGRHAVEAETGPVDEARVPGAVSLLAGRRVVELLPAERFDRDWFDTAASDEDLDRQAEAVRQVPEGCFLAGCRDALLDDMADIPATLSIAPCRPDPSELEAALEPREFREVAYH